MNYQFCEDRLGQDAINRVSTLGGFMQHLQTEYLPKSLQLLLTVISMESLRAIVAEYGGTRISVQKKPTADHTIARLIGFEEYSRLCKVYANEMLNIPRCLKAISLVRDQQILAGKRTGLTLAQLARKHSMTEGGITKSLRRMEKQEYQHLTGNAQTDWTRL